MNNVRAFVHRTKISCWKCYKDTPVVYAFRPPNNKSEKEFDSKWIGAYEVTPDQDLAMGLALENKYPWYRIGRSHTMGREVHANFCLFCDSLQGNWYVWKDLLNKRTNGIILEFDEYVDYETDIDAIIEGSPEDEKRKTKMGYSDDPNFIDT